jgi:alpha-L-fucosidase
MYSHLDARDIRFNQTKKYLYATALGWPDDGQLVIKSLAKGNTYFKKSIASVYLLGYGKLKAHQTSEGLVVRLPQPCNQIAPVLRISK